MPNSDCPVCRTADIVCGKWTLLVIRDLADGRSRFCELERSLAGISPRTLSLRLRALEEEGIVARQTFPEVPPRVEYALTEKGRALVPIIESMRAYGTRVARRRRHLQRDPRGPARRRRRLAPGSIASASRSVRTRADAIPRARVAGGSPLPAANRRLMHNRALHDSLAAFVEEAARQLADEVSGGAEVPFELMEMSRTRGPPRRCTATGRSRASSSASASARSRACPPTPPPSRGMAALPDLPAYLQARGRRTPGPDRRSQADAALQAFLTAVWTEATDFIFDPRPLRAGVRRARGHRLRRLHAVRRARAGRRPDDRVRGAAARRGPRARARRARSRTCRATSATTRWRPSRCSRSRARRATIARSRTPAAACAGCRPRCACGTTPSRRSARPPGRAPTAAPGGPSRSPPASAAPTGDCLLAAEEEDALRAFCSLVSRRTPRAGELAWALRRFELGCERASAVEALTDWLLAARALLADPDQPGYAGVAERMAAICAAPEDRARAEARISDAISLERAAVAGLVRAEPDVEELISELGGEPAGDAARRALRAPRAGAAPRRRRAHGRGARAANSHSPAGFAPRANTRRLTPGSAPNRCSRTCTSPSTSWTSSSSSGTTIVGGSPSCGDAAARRPPRRARRAPPARARTRRRARPGRAELGRERRAAAAVGRRRGGRG